MINEQLNGTGLEGSSLPELWYYPRIQLHTNSGNPPSLSIARRPCQSRGLQLAQSARSKALLSVSSRISEGTTHRVTLVPNGQFKRTRATIA
jgi:hypothetical protein